MKRFSALALVLLTGLFAVRLPYWQAGSRHTITTFEVPGAGTGEGQGTIPIGITADGSVAGYYIDSEQRKSCLRAQFQRRYHELRCSRRGNGRETRAQLPWA